MGERLFEVTEDSGHSRSVTKYRNAHGWVEERALRRILARRGSSIRKAIAGKIPGIRLLPIEKPSEIKAVEPAELVVSVAPAASAKGKKSRKGRKKNGR